MAAEGGEKSYMLCIFLIFSANFQIGSYHIWRLGFKMHLFEIDVKPYVFLINLKLYLDNVWILSCLWCCTSTEDVHNGHSP